MLVKKDRNHLKNSNFLDTNKSSEKKGKTTNDPIFNKVDLFNTKNLNENILKLKCSLSEKQHFLTNYEEAKKAKFNNLIFNPNITYNIENSKIIKVSNIEGNNLNELNNNSGQGENLNRDNTGVEKLNPLRNNLYKKASNSLKIKAQENPKDKALNKFKANNFISKSNKKISFKDPVLTDNIEEALSFKLKATKLASDRKIFNLANLNTNNSKSSKIKTNQNCNNDKDNNQPNTKTEVQKNSILTKNFINNNNNKNADNNRDEIQNQNQNEASGNNLFISHFLFKVSSPSPKKKLLKKNTILHSMDNLYTSYNKGKENSNINNPKEFEQKNDANIINNNNNNNNHNNFPTIILKNISNNYDSSRTLKDLENENKMISPVSDNKTNIKYKNLKNFFNNDSKNTQGDIPEVLEKREEENKADSNNDLFSRNKSNNKPQTEFTQKNPLTIGTDLSNERFQKNFDNNLNNFNHNQNSFKKEDFASINKQLENQESSTTKQGNDIISPSGALANGEHEQELNQTVNSYNSIASGQNLISRSSRNSSLEENTIKAHNSISNAYSAEGDKSKASFSNDLNKSSDKNLRMLPTNAIRRKSNFPILNKIYEMNKDNSKIDQSIGTSEVSEDFTNPAFYSPTAKIKANQDLVASIKKKNNNPSESNIPHTTNLKKNENYNSSNNNKKNKLYSNESISIGNNNTEKPSDTTTSKAKAVEIQQNNKSLAKADENQHNSFDSEHLDDCNEAEDEVEDSIGTESDSSELREEAKDAVEDNLDKKIFQQLNMLKQITIASPKKRKFGRKYTIYDKAVLKFFNKEIKNEKHVAEVEKIYSKIFGKNLDDILELRKYPHRMEMQTQANKDLERRNFSKKNFLYKYISDMKEKIHFMKGLLDFSYANVICTKVKVIGETLKKRNLQKRLKRIKNLNENQIREVIDYINELKDLDLGELLTEPEHKDCNKNQEGRAIKDNNNNYNYTSLKDIGNQTKYEDQYFEDTISLSHRSRSNYANIQKTKVKRFKSIGSIYNDLKLRIEKIDKRLLENLNQVKNKSFQNFFADKKKAASGYTSFSTNNSFSFCNNINATIEKQDKASVNHMNLTTIKYADLFQASSAFSKNYIKQNGFSSDSFINSNFSTVNTINKISDSQKFDNKNFNSITSFKNTSFNKSYNLPIIHAKETLKKDEEVGTTDFNNNCRAHKNISVLNKQTITGVSKGIDNYRYESPYAKKSTSFLSLNKRNEQDYPKLGNSSNKNNNHKTQYLSSGKNFFEETNKDNFNNNFNIINNFSTNDQIKNMQSTTLLKFSQLNNTFKNYNSIYKPNYIVNKEQNTRSHNSKSISSNPLSNINNIDENNNSKNFKDFISRNYLITEDFNQITPKKYT